MQLGGRKSLNFRCSKVDSGSQINLDLQNLEGETQAGMEIYKGPPPMCECLHVCVCIVCTYTCICV